MRTWITVHEMPNGHLWTTKKDRLANSRELDVFTASIEFIEPCRMPGDEPEDDLDYSVLHLHNSKIVCCENRWELQQLTYDD